MEPDGYLAPSGSRSAGYTNGMKTAISVPDSLFNQAEELARRIYQEALKEYLLRRDLGAVTEAMDRALAEIDQVSDPWFSQASRQALERSEW
jgi:hypothetical protein